MNYVLIIYVSIIFSVRSSDNWSLVEAVEFRRHHFVLDCLPRPYAGSDVWDGS